MKLVITLFLTLYKFSTTFGVISKFQMPEGWHEGVLYWGPTNIRRYCKKGFVYPFGWNFLSLYWRAARKAHNASLNLSPISILALGSRENQESLKRVGGTQELSGVQRILGSSAGFKSQFQIQNVQLFYFISVQNWGLVCNEILHSVQQKSSGLIFRTELRKHKRNICVIRISNPANGAKITSETYN
jgi:hypothetical protein